MAVRGLWPCLDGNNPRVEFPKISFAGTVGLLTTSRLRGTYGDSRGNKGPEAGVYVRSHPHAGLGTQPRCIAHSFAGPALAEQRARVSCSSRIPMPCWCPLLAASGHQPASIGERRPLLFLALEDRTRWRNPQSLIKSEALRSSAAQPAVGSPHKRRWHHLCTGFP